MTSRPLRVLHLLNTVRETGNGIVNTAIDLAWGQARLGHEVHVASAGGEFASRLSAWGIAHHALDQRRGPITLLRAADQLRRLLRECRPDVVHAHMVTGVVLARLARPSRARGGPLLVGHVHNVYQRSARIMALADVVLCCGTSVRETMRARGVSVDRLRVVLNGTVGTPRLPDAATVVPAALSHPAIVTVAGMSARKGIGDLIGAFSAVANDYPDAHLYLVGDGPDRARFEAQARRTAVADRIHFEGFQRDPTPWLRAADIFVLASHRESFPIVLGEARAAGCAIIARAVDGVPEALDWGRAGLLVDPVALPPIDPAGMPGWRFIEPIERLLSDPTAREALRRGAREGLERFHVSRMVDETLALYRSALP